ncbi:MAG: WD40/YVTN/BNR-like repeat-containing protein [Acidimicrobiia bacterium]
MNRIVVATSEGIAHIAGDEVDWVYERPVTHLTDGAAGWWAVTPKGELLARTEDGWVTEAQIDAPWRANCVAAAPARVVVGTSEAHLVELTDRHLELVSSFEDAPSRRDWYTPWGGPPDVRSLAFAGDRLYVNVHVGGILASDEKGWSPTIDYHADVHHVITSDGLVLAASARGLAFSRDAGASWDYATRGLHATYERAVAVCGDTVLVSVSSGPRGGKAAVYRGTLDGEWERCRSGLPEWFSDNVDTFRLIGAGPEAALGTTSGEIYRSSDAGLTWKRIATGLGSIKALEFES